jgi:hypothetical protein
MILLAGTALFQFNGCGTFMGCESVQESRKGDFEGRRRSRLTFFKERFFMALQTGRGASKKSKRPQSMQGLRALEQPSPRTAHAGNVGVLCAKGKKT